MIISFRYTEDEFGEHLAHIRACPRGVGEGGRCGHLAHLPLAVARQANVDIAMDPGEHPEPNQERVVRVLAQRERDFKLRRFLPAFSAPESARQRRQSRRLREQRALTLIREAWMRQDD